MKRGYATGRWLELSPAAREPLEPERAAELYPLVSDVRGALGRLVEALAAGGDKGGAA